MKNDNSSKPQDIHEKKRDGKVEEMKGALEKKAGQLLGRDDMEQRGRARKARGEDKQESAAAEGRVKGKANEVAGRLIEQAGEALKSKALRKKGEARRLEGEAQQSAASQ